VIEGEATMSERAVPAGLNDDAPVIIGVDEASELEGRDPMPRTARRRPQ
jgi:hypothetical protein